MEFAQFADRFENGELTDNREIFPPLDVSENQAYDLSIAVFFNFSSQEITAEYLSRIVKSCENLYHFFIVAPTVTKKNMTGTIDRKAQTFITDISKKSKGDEPPYRFEIFKQEELLFNVLKHDLVPEHKLMNEQQKAELLSK